MARPVCARLAGTCRIFELDAERVQVMHDGTLVLADSSCGAWMSRIIAGLRDHHEPQDELLFHALLAHVRPGPLVVELGAYSAFYTNWYLGAVPGSRVVCIEPEPAHLEICRRNLALNRREARLIRAVVGEVRRPAGDDGLECLDMPALEERIYHEPIALLHMDVQAACLQKEADTLRRSWTKRMEELGIRRRAS